MFSFCLTNEEKKFLKSHSDAWAEQARPLVEKMVFLAGSESLKKKIEDVIYNTAFAIHCKTYDGFEMISTLLDEENLPTMPKGKLSKMDILDMFPEDHPLSRNKTFEQFQHTMYEISNKGKGKGELLLSMVIRGATTSTGDEDVTISQENGTDMHVEVKAGNATLKGTPDASRRAIDAFLDEYFPGERMKRGSSPQFETDDLDLVEKMLTSLYGFDDGICENVLNCYNRTSRLPNKEKIKERKQAVGFEIMRRYKVIDGFDVLAFLKPHKGGISICVINDFSLDNKKNICDNINFKPQTKRGGGTQAVGDGYTDAELRLR